MRWSGKVRGKRGAPLAGVLEEGSGVVRAVNRSSDGVGSAESPLVSRRRIPVLVDPRRDRSSLRGSDFSGSQERIPIRFQAEGGGSSDVGLRRDSSVGAAGGVGETRESFASKWARGIKSRADAADSRRRKGRGWISGVMSDCVTRDRAARSAVLREGREKLASFRRSKEEARVSAEEARKSRASDWMSAHVKLGREWSPPWDRVMGALPVGDAGAPDSSGRLVHRPPLEGHTTGLGLAGGKCAP